MKVFTRIATEPPATPLLDTIKHPDQLKQLSLDELNRLADELRADLMYAVRQTGGHFGANLGVIELTIALHHVLNTPVDRLVWDVGHQAYPHKILTGRREKMPSLRQKDGLTAFPHRLESEFDTFGVGHSSTSISACLGMAISARLSGKTNRHVAVIGDGAMTAGMAFEALSHAGDVEANVLVILNDNQMSISESVGGLSSYLSRIWASQTYNHLRQSGKKVLRDHPTARSIARKTEEHVKGLVSSGNFFEELGFNYVGPIDGHNIENLVTYLDKLLALEGPQLLHVVTKKGKGFLPAEQDPIGYHALTKLEPRLEPQSKSPSVKSAGNQTQITQKYADVFGQWLCDQASVNPQLVGITPAMREGSNLIQFSLQYPDRYFDVAIAEQHAVTFAAGLACSGHKPVLAIYSTFLQRGYDQFIHDVAIQELDVLFAIDRAGLVGADGATHNGAFDLSFLRCIPNLVLMAPADENDCRQMLHTGFMHPGPAAVRYPRGKGPGTVIEQNFTPIAIGQSRTIRKGRTVAILSFGALLAPAQQVAEQLDATLIDMRFVKPLDTKRLETICTQHQLLVSLEENTICGGAGSAILEWLTTQPVQVPMLLLGLPDRFIEQGSPEQWHAELGLDASGIKASIEQRAQQLKIALNSITQEA